MSFNGRVLPMNIRRVLQPPSAEWPKWLRPKRRKPVTGKARHILGASPHRQGLAFTLSLDLKALLARGRALPPAPDVALLSRFSPEKLDPGKADTDPDR